MRFAVCGGGLAHEHHACFRKLVAVINLVDFDFRFDVELRFVEILEVQLDGKKRMDTKSFLMGNKIEIGALLGE